MKRKNFSKKLVLNKSTVVHLNAGNMKEVKGGVDVSDVIICGSLMIQCPTWPADTICVTLCAASECHTVCGGPFC